MEDRGLSGWLSRQVPLPDRLDRQMSSRGRVLLRRGHRSSCRMEWVVGLFVLRKLAGGNTREQAVGLRYDEADDMTRHRSSGGWCEGGG